MAICESCRADFNKARVRASIDNYWGSGRYEWVLNHSGLLCEDCANSVLYMEDDDGNAVDPENIIYPD